MFDFTDYFSNFIAFDEIKWLLAFAKYTTQNL